MPRPPGPPCSVCGGKHYSSGLCRRHYTKLKVHGDANAPDRRRKGSVEDRFWRFVEKSDECWTWTGRLNHAGYGVFATGEERGSVRAHRFAYELTNGAVPDGLVLDHLCRIRNCVRPDHLEPVTQRENMRRSETATRESCPRGHAMGGANIRLERGGRRCRECALQRQREYRQRKRAQAREGAQA